MNTRLSFLFVVILFFITASYSQQQVVIVEIMYDTDEINTHEWQWIKIYNPNNDTYINTTGYVIANNASMGLTGPNVANTLIPPETSAILYNGAELSEYVFRDGWYLSSGPLLRTIVIAVNPWPGFMDNNDFVGIWQSFEDYNNSMPALESLQYFEDSNDWPSDYGGTYSIHLTNIALNNNNGSNWMTSTYEGMSTPLCPVIRAYRGYYGAPCPEKECHVYTDYCNEYVACNSICNTVYSTCENSSVCTYKHDINASSVFTIGTLDTDYNVVIINGSLRCENSTSLNIHLGVAVTLNDGLYMGGSLNMIATGMNNFTYQHEYLVISTSCAYGEFDEVSIEGVELDRKCEYIESDVIYKDGGLYAVFSLNTDTCTDDESSTSNTTIIYIAVGCVAGILIIFLIFALIATHYEPLRDKIFPFLKTRQARNVRATLHQRTCVEMGMDKVT